MTLKNINSKNERGFTIVELLIVIVVIAILAAITLVAYNGVTAKAKTAAAQSAAQSVQSKAEAYNADNAVYPNTFAQLTATSTADYYVSGVTLSSTALTSAITAPSVINFYNCQVGGTGAYVANAVGYWNYSGAAENWVYTGTLTGTPTTTSPTSLTGTTCALSTT